MFFVHEVHHVKGACEDDFELAYRDEFMPTLAKSDDARLLWYLHHAHGTGPAYQVVTITAVRDGQAWAALASRLQEGDLSPWARTLDELRHDVLAKTLLPVSWSPMADPDLAQIPSDGRTHELSLYMEDTGWPHAPIDDYVRFWNESYYRPMLERGPRLLDIQAVFRPTFGSGHHKEAILMQKIISPEGLLHLLTTETPPELRAPGQFMHEALAFRDRWESKLFRTSAWSPLY